MKSSRTFTAIGRSVVLASAAILVSGLAVIALGSALRPGPRPLPEGVTAQPLTTSLRSCIGSPETLRASYRLVRGLDLRAAFPDMGIAPEMDQAPGPLNAVVYLDGWPGMTLPAMGSTPSKDRPGTVSICVETVDGSPAIAGGDYIVYKSIPLADSVLGGP